MKKPVYKGILNEPIKSRIGLAAKLVYEGGEEEGKEKLNKELGDRMAALYKHYKLPNNPMLYGHFLALRLAQDHIKGFQFVDYSGRNKKGRPKKWKGFWGAEFYCRVQIKLEEKDGRSLREAITHVISDLGLNKDVDAIYPRYQEMLKDASDATVLIHIFEESSKKLPMHRLELFEKALETMVDLNKQVPLYKKG